MGEVELPKEGFEEGTKLWVEYKSKGDLKDLGLIWSTEEYFKSWKKMSEDKGSAPGWSFPHLKSVNPNSVSTDIISELSFLPLLTGYVPEEWEK